MAPGKPQDPGLAVRYRRCMQRFPETTTPGISGARLLH
jgi:hypothetical protein